MKTAEDWADHPAFDISIRHAGILRAEFVSVIKQIQLDAWKQGVIDASEIAGGYVVDDAYSIKEYIHSTTKIPKL